MKGRGKARYAWRNMRNKGYEKQIIMQKPAKNIKTPQKK